MTKVLIIEDEEIIRETILNLLDEQGFEAIAAADGRTGLQLAQRILPDLILCDLRMPELNGYEVLRVLRQNRATTTIPVILLTADSTSNFPQQGQTLGANGYLAKPFSTAELLEAIATYLP